MMEKEDFKRKLTAILSADVKGYSRLMQDDELATVSTITTYRDLMNTLIQQHHGRIVDSPGDNVLAEFSSVVDAVQGAVTIQKELKVRNSQLPDHRKMEFRIGINLGDVIVKENRLYGDGVNIAARLEAVADAGGICISRSAFDQIENKLPLGYEYIGELAAKNMQKPLQAYKVSIWPDDTGSQKYKNKAAPEADRQARFPEKHRKPHPISKNKKRIRSRRRFNTHLKGYLGLIGFLSAINILSYSDVIWVHWPALGWGMILFFHWLLVSSTYHKDE
ncbi:MAG: adenylate/guanylate cyclase domain-containing protein [Deltaproteobacteria bacterium]|jgi:class 3 adenylate cyclase|nr:adenylate/guanylate cyclase domain-containing protein [Deltaproteobacteria bacterium]MBT4268377.1 adenylate/guanylate cyclase domain-containing protein [Deltaproteobacteria bacterium]MBT4638998.1 adenylate/guanylate cyclase domain-containing protein [Deltaproteobacteria bacterium]MBT6499136.1 adenylate/guanylate cyclase domain-containing protein [Deltaproteobacteria bacterium]MBT6611080.1 adenylate/guanylate cyclase domain-containing protein [Deltaproteobacteria bacterium]